MKKLLSSLSALMITATTAANVTACTPKEYARFIEHVNNHESFIYFLGALDCPNCQKTKDIVWNNTYNLNTKVGGQNFMHAMLVGDSGNGDFGGQYSWNYFKAVNPSLTEQDLTSLENIHFYSYELPAVKDVFGKDEIKDLGKWVIKQIENKARIAGIPYRHWTTENVGFNATPLFIYIQKGQFIGFDTGLIDSYSKLADIITHRFVYNDAPLFPGGKW